MEYLDIIYSIPITSHLFDFISSPSIKQNKILGRASFRKVDYYFFFKISNCNKTIKITVNFINYLLWLIVYLSRVIVGISQHPNITPFIIISIIMLQTVAFNRRSINEIRSTIYITQL